MTKHRHILLFISILYLSLSACGLHKSKAQEVRVRREYRYQVNLRQLVQDQLLIELETPTIQEEEVVFYIPRIVPGIYGYMDFGDRVSSFVALNDKGETLPVQRLDKGRWKISMAQQLHFLRYRVDDGWENFNGGFGDGRFRSAESSFTENKAFVINHNSLFGYFEGKTQLPFKINIEKPERFFGATTLPLQQSSEYRDEFRAPSYRDLVDNPILYAQADTAMLRIGNTQVLVAAYSDAGAKLAGELAGNIKPLLENQRLYLGGKLPVERYAFLIYHARGNDPGYVGDGLEHATSTLCLMYSQLDEDLLKDYIYRIASHEFFHIVTPLNIHAEEIEQYNFYQPKLSKHLWLYEGMTEYATMHMPVKQGLIRIPEFARTISQKAKEASGYDPELSLTELSVHAVDKPDQYYNVYLKGALVNLCLDILLREKSKGKMGAAELMQALSEKYGPNRPFKDDELFDVIAALSFPEIRDFFRRHVEGHEALPLDKCLEKAGFIYNSDNHSVKPVKQPSLEQLQVRQWWLGRTD